MPDDCICGSLPGGVKVGWIYPSQYEDGSPILAVSPGSGATNPDYGRAVPCACTTARAERRHREFLWTQANLPVCERGAWRFGDYQCTEPGQKEALTAVTRWASGGMTQRWLLLRGPVGCGKTHLVSAAVAALVGGRVHARYEYVPDLIDYLRLGQIDGRYEERIALLRSVEALALDDLGATTSSDTEWARGELLKVIDYRYRERAPLVVTCNFANIWEHFDERLADRLTEQGLSYDMPMTWSSYRQVER